jgi:hypothetical protein
MNIRICTLALTLAAPVVLAQPNGVPPGPPPVEISGTVDTNIINTPLDVNVANAPDVVVANTLLTPVPTVLGGEPFQSTSSFDTWVGKEFRSINRDIPIDKMLIVQTVSVSARVEIGQEVRAEVRSQGAGFALHHIPLSKQGTFDGLDLYVGTATLTSYATGSGGVRMTAVRNSTTGNGGEVEFAISGYLVDIP